MALRHALERIVVVPRNGYINRLQAWASTAILGAELDVPVRVLWEPEPIAPAGPERLFAAHLLETTFIDAAELTGSLGRPHSEWPRHLTVDGPVAFLAGHDLGEQYFMDELAFRLSTNPAPKLLVIVAGGKFHLPDDRDFVRQRQVFYSQVDWSPDVGTRVSQESHEPGSYLGLHLRGTDRSRSAPTAHAVRAAMSALGERTGLTSMFVAADTLETRHHWHSESIRLGFDPWSTGEISFDRTREDAGVDALVDWILLGQSLGIVYSRESSFAEEAAVATNHFTDCRPVTASAGLQRIRRAREVARAATTYPQRHWITRGTD